MKQKGKINKKGIPNKKRQLRPITQGPMILFWLMGCRNEYVGLKGQNGQSPISTKAYTWG